MGIIIKRVPLKMLTGAKKGSPMVPSKSKLKLQLKDGKEWGGFQLSQDHLTPVLFGQKDPLATLP